VNKPSASVDRYRSSHQQQPAADIAEGTDWGSLNQVKKELTA
jgi:hypothetical protein